MMCMEAAESRRPGRRAYPRSRFTVLLFSDTVQALVLTRGKWRTEVKLTPCYLELNLDELVRHDAPDQPRLVPLRPQCEAECTRPDGVELDMAALEKVTHHTTTVSA